MEREKPKMRGGLEESTWESEEVEGEPERLGPYWLIEQVPQSEHRLRGELYRAENAETGAAALVLKLASGEEAPPRGVKGRYQDSADPKYVAVEVDEAPWATATRKLKMEELVHAFESMHAGMGRMARLLEEEEEQEEEEPPLPPPGRASRALAVLAAVCALILVGAALAPGEKEEPPSRGRLQALTHGVRDDAMPKGRPAPAEKMPKEPMEGQKLPPCRRPIQVELYGGCWMPHKVKAPCPDGLYEHEGECYVPIIKTDPPPRAGGDAGAQGTPAP